MQCHAYIHTCTIKLAQLLLGLLIMCVREGFIFIYLLFISNIYLFTCQMVPAMNGSPKPCYPLRHSHQWSFETPSVVQVETSFRKVHVQTSQTMIMKNYDGSEVAKTVTRHRDGVETVVELTTYPDSKVLLREFVKNLASGKSRKYILVFYI